jgi:hypothetical protein
MNVEAIGIIENIPGPKMWEIQHHSALTGIRRFRNVHVYQATITAIGMHGQRASKNKEIKFGRLGKYLSSQSTK